MKNTDVIILAAGSIKHKLHFIRYINNSPALIPLGMNVVVSYIIDFYKNETNNIFLVINKEDEVEVENELVYYLDRIKIFAVNGSEGVNDSLLQVLERVTLSKNVIVNLTTTVPTKLPRENEVFISKEKFINADFSTICIRDKKIDFLYKENEYNIKGYAFTGIFKTSKDGLYKAICNAKKKQDLLEVINNLYNMRNITFTQIDWIDCGHEANYYKAKSRLITSRSFNNIGIDNSLGTITKTSKNKDKFNDEISYIHLLPKEIQILFPRILSEVKKTDSALSVKMEYYGYPTLAEYMVFWELKKYSWDDVYRALFTAINLFKKYPYSIGKKAHLEFYQDKLNRRLFDFQEQLPDQYRFLLKDSYLHINSKKYKNFILLKKRVLNKINSLYNENEFNIMHGDFCFNNILYDLQTGIIRLIDARGSFSDSCKGIYGDTKYDLAKLSHSTVGCYDYIISRLYILEINLEEKRIDYNILRRSNFVYLSQLNDKLIEELGYRTSDIYFIMALLFLSMPPLHSDSFEKQVVMYTHGIVLLNKYLED